MAYYYADSSVLVRRHAHEVGTAWIQALTDPTAGHVILTSRISIVEVISAFQRKQRDGTLTASQLTQLTTDFLAVCATEYAFVDVTANVLHAARTLVQQYPLKAYDAVQLASAVLTNTAFQRVGLSALTVLAADRQLLSAVGAEGLAMDAPHLHP